MALKGDRNEVVTDISYFMNEVAERGGVVVLSTAGSGAALDQSQALVTYHAAPSGQSVVGMLMNDMVNVDQTKYHLNWYKEEVQKGSKVCVLRDGWAVTNMIYPGLTPSAGATAYVAHSGYLHTSDVIGGARKCGQFLSTKDEDGYAKVYVRTPVV